MLVLVILVLFAIAALFVFRDASREAERRTPPHLSPGAPAAAISSAPPCPVRTFSSPSAECSIDPVLRRSRIPIRRPDAQWDVTRDT